MINPKWFGGILTQIKTTTAVRPEGSVVEIPNGLERLRSAIRKVQNDIVQLQCREGDYIAAFQACQAEYSAAMQTLSVEQHDALTRLARLQHEWVQVSAELGIRAEAIPPPLTIDTPSGPIIAEIES